MAILTKFLKLLKPERNDYVDVDKHISENYDKIDSKMQELDKKASKTELGRVKIGDNLTITEDGVLSGNPEYTHPVGAGYKHIPAGGTTGQVLKNNGDGSAEWGTLDIKDKLDRGNLPATIPDAKTFYDLIEKGYGAELDENLFYLNDSGTKQVGYLYFDKNKKGLFRCIKQTTGTVNSTEYFVDASPSANYDRFGNLCEYILNTRINNTILDMFVASNLVFISISTHNAKGQDIFSRFNIPRKYLPKKICYGTCVFNFTSGAPAGYLMSGRFSITTEGKIDAVYSTSDGDAYNNQYFHGTIVYTI